MEPPMKLSKESDEQESHSNHLWVGNLAADVTDSDLTDLFAKYGAIDSITTYSFRSYAFLYFKRAEDAAAARDSLRGMVLRGSPLIIEFARPARPGNQLWVNGISPLVSKEQLEEEFLKFGKIKEYKFLRDWNNAYIEYVKLEDALEATRNMNGKRILGEQIHVDFLRSQSLRREPDFRDSKEGKFPVIHYGVRSAQHSQPSAGRNEGLPSNILWVGYPPSLQIDEQMLHNAMILFGEIERIKSFPSRHYLFVEFRSVDEARRAKEGLQGRLFNDPRITIKYSSSELYPGKEYSMFHAGVKGSRPDVFREHLFGSNQLEMPDHHGPMGLHASSPGSLPPNSTHRPNLQFRPFGPQGGFDPVHSGAEFNELAPLRNFRDGSSNIPVRKNSRRPSPPVSVILPSPASRIRPSARSVSTGWDVLDPNQYQREPKHSRIDVPSTIDDDSFASRKIDDRLVLDKTYRLGPATDTGISGPFINVHGKRSLSPVGVRGTIGSHQPCLDSDFIWRGVIAKGGTPVCHARCVPIGKGLEFELPEVINCSARTGLDMLVKHYDEEFGFDIVFFLPDNEDDFASFTEFLHYLGSKNRAGVAKFDDGTTLFLVPPSDFLTKVLKVAGPERLYGVVLKFGQQVPSSASLEPKLHQPSHFPQFIDRHQIPPPDHDYNQIAQKDRHIPVDYSRVLHEESKPPTKSSHPPTEFIAEQSVPHDYDFSNTTAVSQVGVSLTPELVAALSTILPSNSQSTFLEGGQPASGSSVVRPSYSSDNGASGNTTHLQFGSVFNSKEHVQSQFQLYPSFSSGPNHSANMVRGSSQIQDSSLNLPLQGRTPLKQYQLEVPHQKSYVGMVHGIDVSGSYSPSIQSDNAVAVSSQSGQVALSPSVSQKYQLEVPPQKSYAGTLHGIDASGSYIPSIPQSNNPVCFSNQPHGGIHSQTQYGLPLSTEKVNWDITSQVPRFQTAVSGAGQGTSDDVVDKNQRYQSTLQFAANLLLQIQQQQQQQ